MPLLSPQVSNSGVPPKSTRLPPRSSRYCELSVDQGLAAVTHIAQTDEQGAEGISGLQNTVGGDSTRDSGYYGGSRERYI